MPERRIRRDEVRWRTRAAPPVPRAIEDRSAAEQLRRLLLILPVAVREGETTLSELAELVGIEPSVIEADLHALQEGLDLRSADAGADVQILLEGDRVEVWTKGDFRRPVRLSSPEALALGLALRMAALSPSSLDADGREKLRSRLEAALAVSSEEDLCEAIESPEMRPDHDVVIETVFRAARERRPCTLRYLKPDEEGPEERRIHVYCIAQAEGSWYAIGYCDQAEAIRTFRTDRILDAWIENGPFHDEPSFDPADYLSDGRAFRPDQHEEAVVRYSPQVARWVAESERGDRKPDGSYVVRHVVADPTWLVRRVLGYAGEAEILDPAALRRSVADAAKRVAARHH